MLQISQRKNNLPVDSVFSSWVNFIEKLSSINCFNIKSCHRVFFLTSKLEMIIFGFFEFFMEWKGSFA